MEKPPRAGLGLARLLHAISIRSLLGRLAGRAPLSSHVARQIGRFGATVIRLPRRADFARLTTLESVEQWRRQGKLARVLLLPAVFGGMDAEANAAYVPPEVLPVQQRLLATLERYRSEGRIDTLTVLPEYKGRSLIPARIRVQAGKEGRVGAFTTVIGIW
jgi:hypothetical protein